MNDDPSLCQAKHYLQQAAKELYDITVVRVNDLLGHEMVLRMYSRAIELASSK